MEGINYAGCLSKEDQCSKLGDKTVLCADELYESYTFEAECMVGSDGNNYWMGVELIDYCDDYCSEEVAGECGESWSDITPTGKSCDEKTYSLSCDNDGNILYCESSAEYLFECSSYVSDGYACITFSDYYEAGVNYADCLSSSSECSTEGETRSVCYSYYDEGNYQTSQKCTKGSDNKLYWIKDASAKNKSCANSCNEDKTDCDSKGYAE